MLPLEFMVDGQRKTATLPAVLSVNGADTYRVAALHGLGLIQVPRYAVERDLAAGALVECLPDTPPSPTPVYALYPRSRQLSLRLRVFLDWIVGRIREARRAAQLTPAVRRRAVGGLAA